MLVRTLGCGVLLGVLSAVPAAAQDTPPTTIDTRPALPTFYGDTGLWFVSSAETLPPRRWSFSLFRANFDRRQGLTDISQVGITGAVGLGDRFELFGSWRLVNIDRDVSPTFVPSDVDYGGVLNDYPHMRRGWSKTLGGPISVGGKWNFLSQGRNQPMGLAARGMMAFPSGSSWASTNDLQGQIDFIASAEANAAVEVTGSAGWIVRSDPDEFGLSDGFKWGVGTAFPSRSPFRALVEVEGELVRDDELTLLTPPLVAEDGSVAPLVSTIHDPTSVKAGLVWQARRGWFVHGGVNYSVGTGTRTVGGREVNHTAWGWDVRGGFHPGVRRYAPPPPLPPPPSPPEPAPPPNRPPTFTAAAQCDPCTIEAGKSTALSAQASDPESDAITYRWSAPAGTFGTPNESTTTWTAPGQEGTVLMTVTAEDSKGASATSTVSVRVVRPALKTYTFQDAHFAFDRYNLSPEAVKILDEAVITLRDNPNLRVTIEGHTDSTGTPEYNLGLGDRRANAARDYLVNRGVEAGRMETVSFGEERPKAGNDTSKGRATNRRAALVVKIQ